MTNLLKSGEPIQTKEMLCGVQQSHVRRASASESCWQAKVVCQAKIRGEKDFTKCIWLCSSWKIGKSFTCIVDWIGLIYCSEFAKS